MTGTTLYLCVSPAMQGFMQREVTDGTEERVIPMSDGRDGHFPKGQGRSKSLPRVLEGNGAAPSCVLFANLNGVLNPNR